MAREQCCGAVTTKDFVHPVNTVQRKTRLSRRSFPHTTKYLQNQTRLLTQPKPLHLALQSSTCLPTQPVKQRAPSLTTVTMSATIRLFEMKPRPATTTATLQSFTTATIMSRLPKIVTIKSLQLKSSLISMLPLPSSRKCICDRARFEEVSCGGCTDDSVQTLSLMI